MNPTAARQRQEAVKEAAKDSRGLRHGAGEILGIRLICLHNLHFYPSLARRAREAIESGTFPAFRAAFVSHYTPHVFSL